MQFGESQAGTSWNKCARNGPRASGRMSFLFRTIDRPTNLISLRILLVPDWKTCHASKLHDMEFSKCLCASLAQWCERSICNEFLSYVQRFFSRSPSRRCKLPRNSLNLVSAEFSVRQVIEITFFIAASIVPFYITCSFPQFSIFLPSRVPPHEEKAESNEKLIDKTSGASFTNISPDSFSFRFRHGSEN